MSTGASRSLSLIGLALGATIGSACQAPLQRFEFTEIHMGVPVRIALYATSGSQAETSARAGFARIRGLDAVMSDYRPDSELVRLGATAGRPTPVSQDLFAVLTWALEIAEATDGAFDPTLGPLTALWRRSRESGRLPDPDELQTARALVGWRLLQLDPSARTARLAVPGMTLDLGGIAKGFILQEAASALRDQGVDRLLIEAGGDVVVGNEPPGQPGWWVDVPDASGSLAARASALTNAALSTSGATEQFVEIEGVRYSHVIDPATGLGLTHSVIVYVIAPDGATADALATAFGIAGIERSTDLLPAFPDVVMSAARRPPEWR